MPKPYVETVIESLDRILIGIDATETEIKEGWWETSKGAEFGASKRQELRDLLRQKIKEVVEITRKEFETKNEQ